MMFWILFAGKGDFSDLLKRKNSVIPGHDAKLRQNDEG